MPDKLQPKVCYILPVYDPDTGGHFFHLYDFLDALASVADLFLVIERATAKPDRFACRTYVQRFSWLPLRFLELFAVCLSARLGGRDCYVHYSFVGALAAWCVTAITGGEVFYWNSGMAWLYQRSFVREAMFRFILRHTILVTHPAGLAEEYRKHYGLRRDRIRIVPQYISVARFLKRGPGYSYDRSNTRQRLGIPSGAQVVLFIHRLSRRKGAHLLPEIVAGVTKERNDVIFVIVGDGPERKNLESRIQNLELKRYVRLAGEVPQREIPGYFSAADVCINPSEEEGFPHVLLEAMAAGVPYVATDVGGVREITPPDLQSYVVPSGGSLLFIPRVLDLLTLSAAECASISAAEQQWVQRYDIGAVGERFRALFDTSTI